MNVNVAPPRHWRYYQPGDFFVFEAGDVKIDEAGKAFDDVYYRIWPENRLPLNCEIQIKAYPTEADVEAENCVAIYWKTENRQRSRADAESWTLQVFDEETFQDNGHYIYTAWYDLNDHNHTILEVRLPRGRYMPLPRCWEYDEIYNIVLFNGSNLTLQDAAHCFDEGFRHVTAYHRDEQFHYNRTIRLDAYWDEGDVGYADPVASKFRRVGQTVWTLEYNEYDNDYFDDETYYVHFSIQRENGDDVVFNGFPDTAFDFDEDEDDEEEWEDDWMSSDEESHVNVMDIAMGGALVDIVLA